MVEKELDKPEEQTDKDKKASLKSRIIGAAAAMVFIACLILLLHDKIETFSANVHRDVQKEKLTDKIWAEKVELPGLENFHKVSEVLCRGAQPSREGFGILKKLGIKTIVNLRSFHSDRNKMAGRDFVYEHIYMKSWHPEDKEVVRFLEIVTDKSKQPVFVHCQHGADRTGTMCAVYRIIIQGWSKEEAVDEMTKGGFHFHSVWWNLIRYIEKLDIDK
ncbi:MAG: dual specificity protein phosphatase family protein, partial [Planctomycetota bacterium]